MAIFRFLIFLAIAQNGSAKEYIVGDENEWTHNFNYSAWAQDKEFWVGDKLVFKYPVGVHNVVKVDGVGFRQCVAPDNAEALTSGEDVITLATPGRKWYICGIGKHCEVEQMKLFVNVWGQVESPTPAPGPATSSASGIAISKLYPLMFVILGFSATIVV